MAVSVAAKQLKAGSVASMLLKFIVFRQESRA